MVGTWVCSPYGWQPAPHPQMTPISHDDTRAAAILCVLAGHQDSVPLSILNQWNKEE